MDFASGTTWSHIDWCLVPRQSSGLNQGGLILWATRRGRTYFWNFSKWLRYGFALGWYWALLGPLFGEFPNLGLGISVPRKFPFLDQRSACDFRPLSIDNWKIQKWRQGKFWSNRQTIRGHPFQIALGTGDVGWRHFSAVFRPTPESCCWRNAKIWRKSAKFWSTGCWNWPRISSFWIMGEFSSHFCRDNIRSDWLVEWFIEYVQWESVITTPLLPEKSCCSTHPIPLFKTALRIIPNIPISDLSKLSLFHCRNFPRNALEVASLLGNTLRRLMTNAATSRRAANSAYLCQILGADSKYSN